MSVEICDSHSSQSKWTGSHQPLQDSRREIFYLWARVLLWYTIIFIFSSLPNYKGTETNFETWFGILNFVSRKAAHLFEYVLLVTFVFRAIEKSWKKLFRWHFLLSFVFATLFSVSDEWHQSFVYGRNGSLFDVFVDAVGSLIGNFYCLLKDEKIRKPTKIFQ